MLFDIKNIRKGVEQEYIGFSPNTTNVKPVHLANGMYRGILNEVSDTSSGLFRFVFSASKKDGSVPKGHELERVYEWLTEEQRIDSSVTPASIAQLRPILMKVVAADKPSAVSTAGMESYSAGSTSFVTNDRIAQDAGEFLSIWFSRQAPMFIELMRAAIESNQDPITILATPLFGERRSAKMQIENVENIRCFQHKYSTSVMPGMQTLARTADQLAQHMESHPNKMVQLRMGIILGAFLIVRYMADLEYLYVPNQVSQRPAFLLDLQANDNSPVRLASQRSYILACQSITRFYSWMFGDYLIAQDYGLSELATDYPGYGSPMKTADENVCREVWRDAAIRADAEESPYTTYGQAVYDILALLAEATPIQYLRQIGIRCGLFWPPYNLQPTKHIAPRQDMLEALVRSVCSPGEMLSLPLLQDRLWDTFSIVIGGRPSDLDILIDRGIYQADDKALEENQMVFAQKLKELNFARLLADGVLEVKVS